MRLVRLLVAVTLAAAAPGALCGPLHLCGCSLAEGWSGCNVHLPGMAHCPWCEHPSLLLGVMALTLGGQAAVVLRASRRSAGLAVAAALVSLPLLGTTAAFLAWLPTDYPHFLVRDARRRLGLPGGPISCGGDANAGACCPRGAPVPGGVSRQAHPS